MEALEFLFALTSQVMLAMIDTATVKGRYLDAHVTA